jgi:hypothetical protein
MAPENQEASTAKTRKRSASKTLKLHEGSKVKATIHLTLEASQRLTVHAAMMGMDRSELVEQLIRDHLRRFVVSDRGGVSDISESRASHPEG